MSKRTDVNQLGEFGLIDHITKPFTLRRSSSLKGVGDDAAVIQHSNEVSLVSTDFLVEGIHFDLSYTSLKQVGFKAVTVNVSDIYAMNAHPQQITVSIAISNRFSVEAIEELYAGIEEACAYYNIDLIGGDTTSSPKGLYISVTAIGTAKKDQIAYRNGAKIGDILCVTGYLGGAYVGLQILEREKKIFLEHPTIQPDFRGSEYVIAQLLRPVAQKNAIDILAEAKLKPTAMMDISDGLASEIFHICKQSGVGAILEESHIPIHPQTFDKAAMEFKIDPITCALNGGEDYQLLFTISPNDFAKMQVLPNIYVIGEIVEKTEGIRLRTKSGNFHDLKAQGWQHF